MLCFYFVAGFYLLGSVFCWNGLWKIRYNVLIIVSKFDLLLFCFFVLAWWGCLSWFCLWNICFIILIVLKKAVVFCRLCCFFCFLSCFIKVWAKFCNLIRLVYCALFCVYCWNGLFVAVFVDVFCDSLVVNCWNECYNLYPKA